MNRRAISAGKILKLDEILKKCRRVLIAFSGGKDSYFLLQAAVRALGKVNVHAFFVRTPFTPESSRGRLDYFRQILPVKISEILLDLLRNARLRTNPPDRCYHCKKMMFAVLKKEASRLGIPCVLDGTTLSDLAEHRPGRKALAELGIRSPLKEAGIGSAGIIRHLRGTSLPPEFLHSTTCLATRFPYHHTFENDEIARIGKIENYLLRRGVSPLRVRHMESGVRIETAPASFPLLLSLRASLLRRCRKLGLRFVTLDLAGFRSGSWDRT